MSTPDDGPRDPGTPTPPENPYQQPQQQGQPQPPQYPSPYPQQPYGYGQQPPYGAGYPMPYQAYGPQQDQKALWAMILGIGSIVGATVLFCFYILGIGLGIPAVILGIMAKKDINRSNGALTGGGQATAGLVTGIIGIVLNVLFIILMIVVFATDGFGDPSWSY